MIIPPAMLLSTVEAITSYLISDMIGSSHDAFRISKPEYRNGNEEFMLHRASNCSF